MSVRQPEVLTVVFDGCGHSLEVPGLVARICRRISMWCPECSTMRPWIAGRRSRGRRTRYSGRRGGAPTR